MVAKKRKYYQAIALFTFLFFLAVGIVGFLVFTNWRINEKRVDLRERINILNREIQSLEQEVAGLEAGLIHTETDDFQIEKLYREGYFPEGAVPIVVLPPEEEITEKEEEVPEAKNLWQKFLETLGF